MIKYILLLHTIIELAGGLVLIFRPETLMLSEALTLPVGSVIKLFGVAVVCIGVLSLLMYQRFSYSERDKLAVLLFMGYHMIQGFQCYGMYTAQVMENMGAFTLHMTLALFFLIAYMKESQLFPEKK